ncbi:MAG: D-alanyl-D-alanine carboxypeptidase/D-alanyl-D-alanine-endopeptidase [Phycisphaerae bacterium]|nr:D-alanyl-D-alanine carboxypeptidase/D-alanyl-D-alanine-endopeptidase [Phycisphaerae bacterium]
MNARMHNLLVAMVAATLVSCAPSRVEPVSRAPADSASAALTPAVRQLRADLDAVFDEPKYDCAFWGVRVERANGEVLYDRLGHKQFTTASNMKLYTTAAALERLGPDFTYETRVEAIGTVDADGTLVGDLVIVGSGDPSLGAWHPDADRNSRQVLADWVAKVKAAGIRRITGDIVGDGRCFTSEFYCENWNYGDLHFWYAAGSSGLAIEENAYRVQIRPGQKVGDLAILDITPATSYIALVNDTRTVEAGGANTADSVPHNTEGNVRRFAGTIAMDREVINERGSVWNGACYAAHLFGEALAREGIEVQGRPVNIRMLDSPDRIDRVESARRTILATTISPPLSELVAVVNKISHNFFADQIVRTLGLHEQGTGDFASGAAAVRAWLTDIGAPQAEAFQMRDGSGLARVDAVQPRQTCHLLWHMRQSAQGGEAYYASLPVGGVDGTLAKRLTDPSTKGNVRAKTGYIGHVRCLSGYVTDTDGEELVFSMMCNQYVVPTGEVNDSQDAACKILAQFSANEKKVSG